MNFFFILSCVWLTLSILQYAFMAFKIWFLLGKNPYSKFTLNIGTLRCVLDVSSLSFFIYWLIR